MNLRLVLFAAATLLALGWCVVGLLLEVPLNSRFARTSLWLVALQWATALLLFFPTGS